MNGLMTLSVILALASIGATIYYFALLKSEKEKGLRDIWVINPMTQYTKSKSAIGKLKEIHEKDGWSAVEYFPRGFNFKKLEEKNIKIKPEVIFLPNNNLNWISKGAWDRDCGVLELLPINKDSMPNALENSCYGIGSILKSEEKSIERLDERIKDIRNKNIERMARDISGLNFVRTREKLLSEGIKKEGDNPQAKPTN